MFEFGSAETTAQLLKEQAIATQGPAFPEGDWKQMSLKDLEVAMIWNYSTIRLARRQGASDEVMQVLLDEYDEMFEFYAASSESFREAVRKNLHKPVTGVNKESVAKYKRLAGVLPSAS